MHQDDIISPFSTSKDGVPTVTKDCKQIVDYCHNCYYWDLSEKGPKYQTATG
jgi:hypothetical protein